MIQEDATANAETWSEWAWHLEEEGEKKKATAHSNEFGLKGVEYSRLESWKGQW